MVDPAFGPELQKWLKLLEVVQPLTRLSVMDWLPESLFFLDLGYVWSLLC